MKKLVIALCIAVVAVSIALAIFIKKSQTCEKISSKSGTAIRPSFPANGISLNGLACDNANTMVSAFVDDNTSSDKKTAIWLSKPWIDNIYGLLTTESNTDGFRIYFAKKPDILGNMNNTIVIVSTQNGTDNFVHDNPTYASFFADLKKNPQNYITEDHGGNDPGAKFYYDNYSCAGAPACVFTQGNNLDCETAHGAVKNFRDQPRVYQGINTDSEWFPFKLLKGLWQELSTKPTTNMVPDGIRIYFAKDKTTHRHFFIFVPTQNNGNPGGVPSHLDNFDCFSSSHLLGPNDDGEECPNNCNGTTLPQP